MWCDLLIEFLILHITYVILCLPILFTIINISQMSYTKILLSYYIIVIFTTIYHILLGNQPNSLIILKKYHK